MKCIYKPYLDEQKTTHMYTIKTSEILSIDPPKEFPCFHLTSLFCIGYCRLQIGVIIYVRNEVFF